MEMRPNIEDARIAGAERFEGARNYDNKRRKIVEDSGEVELRRFMLSSDPEVREKLHEFHLAVKDLVENNPEIAGAVLFGSQVKGYANERSDIDSYIIIALDEVMDNILRKKEADPSLNEALELGRLYNNLNKTIVDTLKKIHLSLIGDGIGIRSISEEKIYGVCDLVNFNDIDIDIVHLFQIGIGQGIYEYRELLITTLENMGERGEEAWRVIMEKLSAWENRGFSDELKQKRELLYPKSLAEGREYFLRNSR